MKKQVSIILSAICACILVLTSCDENAKYEIKDVTIQLEKKTTSAGYIEVNFTTSKDAYYLIGIREADDDYNPQEYSTQFMELAIDSAYVEYVTWRHQHLRDGEPYIAEFSSHSLQYGATDYFFNNLKPGTNYWVFAFVVDPDSNKPVGNLYLQKIKTDTASSTNIHFDARVSGRWVYVYPKDSTDKIDAHYPYTWDYYDSLTVDEMAGGDPYQFALKLYQMYQEYGLLESPNILTRGVDFYDDTDEMYFEEGQTYYIIIFGIDGGLSSFIDYKFKWEGDSTSYIFYDTRQGRNHFGTQP